MRWFGRSRIESIRRELNLRLRGMSRFSRLDFDTTRPLPPSASSHLASAMSILDTNGVRNFVWAGTLLGLFRDGQLIPHDSDLDIAVVGEYRRRSIEKLFDKSEWRVCQRITLDGRLSQLSLRHNDGCLLDLTFFWASGSDYFSLCSPDYFLVLPAAVVGSFVSMPCGQIVPDSLAGEQFLAYLYGPEWRVPKKTKTPWAEEFFGATRQYDPDVFTLFSRLFATQ